jgi:signal transduction histidine kinase
VGECEFGFIRKGGTRISANVAASSFHDDAGNCIGTLALVSDITERKNMELNLKESRDKLEGVNEKLRVVGGLTRHDVRNKLAAVTGYAYLLKKKYSGQADIVDRVDKIELAIKDSVKIFEFAKMYEQLGVEELVFVDVERAVDEAFGMFSGLTLKVSNDCHGLTVLADSFLRQMFYNFIDNTRKYGKKTTTIRVYYEKTESGELRMIYEDDGLGISTENKLELFSEGFSTGGTTGFGLFLTKKMMDVYGWTIQETGEPGKGAKFVISIPVSSVSGFGKEASASK